MSETIVDTDSAPKPEPEISDKAWNRAFVTFGLGGLILAGGIAYLAEIGDNAEGRQNAAVAQACLDAYSSSTGSVTDSAVKCMQNDWVPGAEPVYDSQGFKPNMPQELVEGYIVTQNEAANNINVLAVGGWATAGLIGGAFLVAAAENDYIKNNKSNNR